MATKQPKQPTTTTQAPAGAMANMAATLTTTPQPTMPAPQVVLVRGALVQAVALTTKAYKVACPHNLAWWQAVQAAVAQGNGTASVQAIAAAGVPLPFVRYVLARGCLQAAAQN